MKILRVKDDYVNLYDLRDWFDDKDVNVGDKFGISWKVGKRWKLKSYRLINRSCWECDCCGDITSVEIWRCGHNITIDNHFGPSSFGVNS